MTGVHHKIASDWTNPPASLFGVYDYDGTAIATATSTPITLTAVYDPLGWLSSGNSVPTVAGWYQVTLAVIWPNTSANRFLGAIRKDASDITVGVSNVAAPSTGNPTNHVTCSVFLDGDTDAIDARLLHGVGSNQIPTVQLTVRLLGPT